MSTKKYRVLKEGVSQRKVVNGADVFHECAVGEVIEVSDEAAPYMIAEGYIALPGRAKKDEEE